MENSIKVDVNGETRQGYVHVDSTNGHLVITIPYASLDMALSHMHRIIEYSTKQEVNAE